MSEALKRWTGEGLKAEVAGSKCGRRVAGLEARVQFMGANKIIQCMTLPARRRWTGSVSSFRIFKLLGLVLFECIFVGPVTSLCLAQPREREVQLL